MAAYTPPQVKTVQVERVMGTAIQISIDSSRFNPNTPAQEHISGVKVSVNMESLGTAYPLDSKNEISEQEDLVDCQTSATRSSASTDQNSDADVDAPGESDTDDIKDIMDTSPDNGLRNADLQTDTLSFTWPIIDNAFLLVDLEKCVEEVRIKISLFTEDDLPHNVPLDLLHGIGLFKDLCRNFVALRSKANTMTAQERRMPRGPQRSGILRGISSLRWLTHQLCTILEQFAKIVLLDESDDLYREDMMSVDLVCIATRIRPVLMRFEILNDRITRYLATTKIMFPAIITAQVESAFVELFNAGSMKEPHRIWEISNRVKKAAREGEVVPYRPHINSDAYVMIPDSQRVVSAKDRNTIRVSKIVVSD